MSIESDSSDAGAQAVLQAPLTMSIAEFAALSGLSEYTIRQEVALDRIPHRRVGRRGLVRILRLPALAALGLTIAFGSQQK